MYINKVDDLIDRIIDDFYTVIIMKNKKFDKLKEELNFIKSQKDLNEIIVNYIKTIPPSEITDIVKRGDSYSYIFDTIQRYIVIYVFLTIGIFYKGKPDMFINNLIEFTRNQQEYPLKIDNFFNSESNSLIIKLFYMCKNIIILAAKDTINIEYIKKKPYATETMEFISNLSDEFIDAAFRLKSLNNDQADQAHNIIKTLIVLLVYKINDKKILYSMLDQSELSQGEYIFLDVIEAISDTLNFNTIESVLSKKDLFSGLAYDIWDYMEEMDIENKTFITNEEKINILLNSGIIVPILDDFLLYHRDNERYDKITNTGIKKKEDTKVRYIIGKIDTTAELYSDSAKKDAKLKENIMKNFSAPLYNRKAILRNNVEDIKIINKFINQGKRNVENNDYFNDLIAYRKYTYVNFKDFDKYGFSNHFTKTITSVRAVNFDTDTEFKQNPNRKLQLRVGSKDNVANIVGFMIPTNIQAIQCIKIIDVIDVRKLSETSKNGFDIFLNFLKKSIIKGESHKASIYWLFDLEVDKVTLGKVETRDNVTQQDMVKAMIAELYDRIVKEIYFETIDMIDISANVTLDNANKIIKYLEHRILKLPLSKNVYEDIEKYIFEKKITDNQQINIIEDDVLYGLEGNVISLPQYLPNKEENIKKMTIDLAYVDESGKIIETEVVNGVCQHNITWDTISAISKKDYSEYIRQLYNFIQQYVIENTQHDYVCRSCGFCLDIQKYVQDGVFDEEKGFITFSMPMETNLEDIPEYEKFQFSIKIMDKNIEKIASSVGIPYFMGNTTTVKWRRKSIIKNAIDMVTLNNQLLTKTFKERNENKTKMYGISKNLSILFVFDMENNIFQTSSKDKDQEQFKMLKRNNITTYIMIYLILELNESQISFFTTDKKNMCDIRIFDKVYRTLFSGLRIKRNNTNDTVDITKYKMLCYMIYMISCRIAKHRLWYSPQVTEKNIQKLISIIQRFVVHTCVDIINSILENSFLPAVSYIFEIFRVRFYSKLNNLFSDDEYYDILLEQSKFSYASARKRGHLQLISNENLPPYIYESVKWKIEVPVKFFPKYLNRKVLVLNGISNLSNCPSGAFHEWKVVGNTFICKLCSANIKELKYNETESIKIIEKYKIARLNALGQKFCQVDGQPHQYVYDHVTKKNICIKCKKTDDHIYSGDEIRNIDKMMDAINDNRRREHDNMVVEYTKNENTERRYINEVVTKNAENLKNESSKDNPYKFIDDFIDILQSSVGNEIKGEYPIHLRNNIYIIDHDHNGHDLGGKEIIITEADNKIFHKANHPYFKTDVIYYTDRSGARVDVFYDTITRRLLGYKESGRDFVDIKKTNKKIKINYSIYNKIKLLGYTGEYINIDENYKNIKDEYEKNISNITDSNIIATLKQEMYKAIVKDISKIRIDNLKMTLLEFQRIFNRIIYNYTEREKNQDKFYEKDFAKDDKSFDEKNKMKMKDKEGDNLRFNEREFSNYFADRMNSLVNKYKKKLKNVAIKDPSGKHAIFKHWKGISRGIYVENFDDKYFNFDSDLIASDNISRYDDQSKMILYYIIHEFTTLLKYNHGGYMKTNICNFLIEFIDRIFFRYNVENLHINNDIKRFMYILKSVGFLREIEEQIKTDAPQGIYEEYVDIEENEDTKNNNIENQIDEEEENDALDIDEAFEDPEEGLAAVYEDAVDWGLSH